MMSDTRKKILIVAESIDVEDSSGSKANVALIKNLHKAGFDVLVYHYTRKDIQLTGISCHSIKENRRSLLFFFSRTERYLRYWFKLKLHKPIEQIFGFSFTLFNDRNSIAFGLKKIKNFEPDLILTLSKGGSFRPHHALLKLPQWHSKWLAYIHDPYPFSCYPRPYDWVEPGQQMKRDFFIKVSEKTGFMAYPSLLLAEWMESYYPQSKNKRVIIPHQIQENFTHKVLPDFFDKTKFNIVHAGLLLGPRNPMGLIKAFKLFLKENPEARETARLTMIGKFSKYSIEFKKIMKLVPEFYASEEELDFSTVYSVQQSADVNVILEAKSSISPFLPGKIPHCVASNKPILLLGPDISESHRLLGDNYPFWSEIDDDKNIKKSIETLYYNWKNNIAVGLNRNDLKHYLSYSNLKDIIGKVI